MSTDPAHRNGRPSLPGAEPLRLQEIAKDIRQGRNVDLYVAVVVAVVVALLGVLSVVDGKVIAAATLAVLAVVATSMLAGRHQAGAIGAALDRLASDTDGQVAADRFFASRMPPLDVEGATAADIRLVGVTLTRTVRDLLPVLELRLRAGARVRVLLIDVDGNAGAEAAARSRKADAPGFYRRRVNATIDLLRVLATSPPDGGRLQVRLLPFVPTFGMCLIDPEEPHGRIHVEIYQHRTLAADPSFCLEAVRDSQWYQLFREQYELLWQSGRDVAL
ncbi:hypothetical protein FXF50_11115 [Micromonospora sp. AP08]|uniref:hypothetical protein n=1 Tax=Micromonospora sp. AP08 TaxID=2604467 RepID=UPI0011D657F7|nr:hypothetical protein [Micromonospora sp. AP08]TYB38198.1 hypothetical protein FXF50_11115 [Micromonospora sp. AP08]